MGQTPKNELMTVSDTCRFLNLTPPTLYRYLRDQRIPAFKLGTEWRCVRTDLEQWIQDDRTRPSVNS